jgi:hypothetical protein
LLVSVGLRVVAPEIPFYSSFVYALGASFLAAVIGSYATAPTAMDTLASFWQRIRPFGLWRPVVARQDGALVSSVRQESIVDVTSAVAAVCWQITGVVAVISLLLHRWSALALAGSGFVVLGVVLALIWYRNLPPKRRSTPEA